MESMFNLEIAGRVAKAEIRLFDELHAELLDAHMAEKCRHARNLETRGIRTYRKKGNSRSKYGRWSMVIQHTCVGNDYARNFYRENILRGDWKLEQEQEAEETAIENHMRKISEEIRLTKTEKWLAWA